jgi:hypothetical protein
VCWIHLFQKCPLAGSYEHCNVTSGFLEGEEFID